MFAFCFWLVGWAFWGRFDGLKIYILWKYFWLCGLELFDISSNWKRHILLVVCWVDIQRNISSRFHGSSIHMTNVAYLVNSSVVKYTINIIVLHSVYFLNGKCNQFSNFLFNLSTNSICNCLRWFRYFFFEWNILLYWSVSLTEIY